RGASLDDRRHAVRDLADVLEALRADVHDVMLSKDERELFHLANGFAIRHQNRKQRGDYDRPTWLRWAFYVYLATIHAVLRVRDRAVHLPPTPTANRHQQATPPAPARVTTARVARRSPAPSWP